MKILVTVKRVVDFNVKVRVKADQSGVELANVKMSINPFDEIAVEEAVRLRAERRGGGGGDPCCDGYRIAAFGRRQGFGQTRRERKTRSRHYGQAGD